MKKEWFATWFDSPYYHLLYNSRDEQEAKFAIDNLTQALDLKQGNKLLDLGCGKGRHARYLAEKGYHVTGLDLSPNSIQYARQFETANLEFYQHDMRKPFRTNYFDAVLNMFTSFGYFHNKAEHLRTLSNIANGLRPGGHFLLDFFNAHYLKKNLVPEEAKSVGEVNFLLKRWVRKGYVYKSIAFDVAGRSFRFKEQVRLFEPEDLAEMIATAGMKQVKQYGGYDLSDFNAEHSKRLIIIAKKA